MLLILIVILVVFGAGKLPKVMTDLGKGIRGFKKGLSGDDESKNLENKSPDEK